MQLPFPPLLTLSLTSNSLASCKELQFQEHQWLAMLNPMESFQSLP